MCRWFESGLGSQQNQILAPIIKIHLICHFTNKGSLVQDLPSLPEIDSTNSSQLYNST
uniref:Uncharacterized protein n=1 Tax=uncultured delta proteobacterium HF4000_08N17 TaxID=710836 RepID=E0XVF6_9DELT|nr:hypothetical protein [uncultured delta proteobacterium HF4000_08N17]